MHRWPIPRGHPPQQHMRGTDRGEPLLTTLQHLAMSGLLHLVAERLHIAPNGQIHQHLISKWTSGHIRLKIGVKKPDTRSGFLFSPLKPVLDWSFSAGLVLAGTGVDLDPIVNVAEICNLNFGTVAQLG
jgi:hypothetical protein